MKQTKLKFNIKNSFLYAYIAVLLLNIVSLYFVYTFIKANVYDTIFLDESIIEAQATRGVGDINLEKFNRVVDNIEKKSGD